MNIREKQITVRTRKGVHGRIATRMIKIANRHNVRLYIIYDGQHYDCSSVLDILSVALACGTTFILQIAGQEPDRAMQAVEKLMSGRDDS